jgi:hypothetical protein
MRETQRKRKRLPTGIECVYNVSVVIFVSSASPDITHAICVLITESLPAFQVTATSSVHERGPACHVAAEVTSIRFTEQLYGE